MMRLLSKKQLHLNKNISIIGCGWLGLPLAKQFIENNYKVKGSSTSIEKIDILKSFGIDAFYVELTEQGVKGDIQNCLSESEILVLNIPPGLRKHPENDFVNQMQFLITHIEASSIKKIIFISSTSVYADEESIPTITEESIKNPDSPSGKQLLEVENVIENNKSFQTIILRFSGLFGDHRHPAKSLSGRSNLKNANAPVNLIHLKDCIGIIQKLVKKDEWDEAFNASTTPHPSRKDYYTSVCKAMDLPLPKFDEDLPSKGKHIDSSKLKRQLGYEFKVKIE